MGIDRLDFSDRLQVRLPYDEEEEYIDLGAAELSFYAILVELLGRCAPGEGNDKDGKTECHSSTIYSEKFGLHA